MDCDLFSIFPLGNRGAFGDSRVFFEGIRRPFGVRGCLLSARVNLATFTLFISHLSLVSL